MNNTQIPKLQLPLQWSKNKKKKIKGRRRRSAKKTQMGKEEGVPHRWEWENEEKEKKNN